jgi:hypothetical protein
MTNPGRLSILYCETISVTAILVLTTPVNADEELASLRLSRIIALSASITASRRHLVTSTAKQSKLGMSVKSLTWNSFNSHLYIHVPVEAGQLSACTDPGLVLRDPSLDVLILHDNPCKSCRGRVRGYLDEVVIVEWGVAEEVVASTRSAEDLKE